MAETLKDLISQKLPEEAATSFLTYVNDARKAEAAAKAKNPQRGTPVTDNTAEVLVSLAVKYHKLGAPIDGVNTVITGRNMAMVTYIGYKNKVLETYPESEIEAVLVRDGDTFSFKRESGKVFYSHKLADPFANKTGGNIIGAFAVVKNKRGQYLETLNEDDFNKMREQSRQKDLWGKWLSEFWLKSVMKRVCKRYFNDVVAELDRDDNQQYGGVDVDDAIAQSDAAVDEGIQLMESAGTLDELQQIYLHGLDPKVRKNTQVVAAKDRLKAALELNTKAIDEDAESPE